MRTTFIFTPEFQVLSSTLPVVRLLSLVLTNAGPLPGFTCWKSTTWKRSLLYSIQRPFLKSAVVAMFYYSRAFFEKGSKLGRFSDMRVPGAESGQRERGEENEE